MGMEMERRDLGSLWCGKESVGQTERVASTYIDDHV